MTGIIIYKLKRKVGGRICIPKAIDGKPVIGIRGSSYNSVSRTWGKTIGANNSGITQQVYNDAMLNGLQLNCDIEHIYFEGANNNTSSLYFIGEYSLCHMYSLSYLDFPNSLHNVDQYACEYNGKLSFSNVN